MNSALYLSAGKVVMLATFLTWVLLKNAVKVLVYSFLTFLILSPINYLKGAIDFLTLTALKYIVKARF